MAAQASLRLAWSETPEDTFCRVVAHVYMELVEASKSGCACTIHAIFHTEIKSHRIWPILKPVPIRFFKSHRIFRPSYNTFYVELNINHTNDYFRGEVILVKISQNLIRSLKICLISQISVHNLVMACMVHVTVHDHKLHSPFSREMTHFCTSG